MKNYKIVMVMALCIGTILQAKTITFQMDPIILDIAKAKGASFQWAHLSRETAILSESMSIIDNQEIEVPKKFQGLSVIDSKTYETVEDETGALEYKIYPDYILITVAGIQHFKALGYGEKQTCLITFDFITN